MNLNMTVSLPPSVNALYQNQSIFNVKTKTYVPTGKRILTKKGKEMKEKIREEATVQAQEQRWDIEVLGDTMVYMDTVIHFNRKGRDADNLYKALQDSMQGVIYNNDSQVLVRTQRIVYDSTNPRVEVTITPVDFVGIFENNELAVKFEENCMSCTRYLNGRCSILVDSKSGTVREEIGSIYEPVCSKYKIKA